MYRPIIPALSLAVAVSASIPGAANTELADNPSQDVMEEMVVWGSGLSLLGRANSASQGLAGYDDFSTRPLLRVGELVEVIPGMIATQHSGSGKANQYFLRGMNLDHGTDFSAHFEGVPVNLRSHAHGQGYLDINFIIPELVETVQYRKGSYYADVGDFSSAGSSAFNVYDRLEQGFAEITVGRDSYRRLVAADSVSWEQSDLLVGAEIQRQDGPWELEEAVEKYNLLLNFTRRLGNAEAQLITTAYSNRWQATDQIPLREVQAGRLSRFGFVDPDLGGDSQRYSLIGKLQRPNWSVMLYGVHYQLDLYSNPTYFLEDPVNGDEILQADKRNIYGGSWQFQDEATLAGFSIAPRVGVEFRYDDVGDSNLYQTQSRRKAIALIDDEVSELSVSAFAEMEVHWSEELRTTFGLRADHYRWNVDARATGSEQNGGSGTDTIASPKLGLVYSWRQATEFYVNYGHGFHSNDMRGVEIADDPVEPLVKTRGAELGLRTEALPNVKLTLAAFWLDTDSELIFVGDAGTTEPSDGAKRYGLELAAFWELHDSVILDFTATKTRARYKDRSSGEDYVPDAHEFVAGAGITAVMPNGLTASLRARHFGAAPLNEEDSFSKDSTTLVNLGLSYQWNNITLGLDVLNLLDDESNDIEFLFESQLSGESRAVQDIHFHPVAPRSLRATVRYGF